MCAARAFTEGRAARDLLSQANQKVELLPRSFLRRADELLPLVGTKVCDGLAHSARGAASRGFREASKTAPER